MKTGPNKRQKRFFKMFLKYRMFIKEEFDCVWYDRQLLKNVCTDVQLMTNIQGPND